MGDPAHFSVKGGANPHTRTRWGRRRRVDKQRAVEQWHALKAVLEDLGVRVLVVPPVADWPGTVYPANAGIMLDVDTPRPAAERRFVLSNLLPTRAGEKEHYARGLAAADLPGRLERQRFVPALAWPPWRRVYGFRTDVRVREVMAPRLAPRDVVRVELVLEAHYHGDTALCAFGPRREHLLAYRDAIAPADWPALVERFGDALIELGTEDAQRYAANSFTCTPTGQTAESFLVVPAGLSDRLLAQVRERGTTPVPVDVGEFLKKGGGSVKCMIGDLGVVRADDSPEPIEVQGLSAPAPGRAPGRRGRSAGTRRGR